MEILSLKSIFGALISPLVALISAPLLIGIINRTKAVFSGRRGQPLLQAYSDLSRLFRKSSVFSGTTSWIFRIGPLVVFCCVVAAGLFIPFVSVRSPLSFDGDILLMLYLFALARFVMILSALDTGSAFEGMGASREAFFSAQAEPVLLICLFTLARSTGSLTTAGILSFSAQPLPLIVMLTVIPLFIIMLCENARIPFDDPTTHLELTMIHEVMILDHSGPGLALMEYASAVKLWLFAVILARILLSVFHLPVAFEAPAMAVTVMIMGVSTGIVESTMARLQLPKVPLLLASAGAIALLGFMFNLLAFAK